MEAIILLALTISLLFCFQSLWAVVLADLAKSAWKELFKIATILTIIFWIGSMLNK